MENISRLKNLQHRSIFMFVCLGTIHRLVQVRIKLSSDRIDSLGAELSRLSADARGTAGRLDTLLARVNRGEGTLGRFANDTAFYANAQRLMHSLQEFVDDLRKHPGKIGINVRVF